MAFSYNKPLLLSLLCLILIFLPPLPIEAATKKYQFDVVVKNVSRLCNTKPIITVNGEFPGPTIYVQEGDNLLINVTNYAQYNMSIHWHGLKQFRSGWADGPAYITQCPIQSGASYVYGFNVTGQRGTLWWHAHIMWLRATVHGAFVITPKKGDSFPFPKPHGEINLILGEWWNGDVEEMVKQEDLLGLPANSSDAYTINGKPGPLFPCSENETFVTEVEQGKTYLLRIINAALNNDLLFSVAGHSLTVVELDAVYCKPFSAPFLLVSPGQTTAALLVADRPPTSYSAAARPFVDNPVSNVTMTAATATFKYIEISSVAVASASTLPNSPASNDTFFVTSYNNRLRSLNSPDFPANVPLSVDRKLFYTVGLGLNPCPTCPDRTRFTASLNNITFVTPKTALLQAHYHGIRGVFRSDFPDKPAVPFNYTGMPLTANLGTAAGTRVSRVLFNSTVELVLQDTNLLTIESHPFHLHGYNFFLVGSGVGNFDPVADPARFNLVDPPERNTVRVPAGGWAAVRFRANNPGVWFMHCHLEVHASWGLEMAFLVENGEGPDESILPPPKDLPLC